MRAMTPGPALRSLARRAAFGLVDAVLPPVCLSCNAMVGQGGGLCAACWARIDWLGPPACACCGLPFAHDPGSDGGGDGVLCGACIRRRPAFDRARAAFAYDEASRGLVLAFKHADRTQAAPEFGAWLARAGAALLPEADLLVPVPLHWTRLLTRRYNQSALLALALGRIAGRPVAPDLLRRVRRTPSQQGLDRSGRQRNVHRAFRIAPRSAHRLAGARVLLVDDVFTTGATLEECARALLAAGAEAVDALTLARVVRPGAA